MKRQFIVGVGLSSFFYRIASWKTLALAVVLVIPFPAYVLPTFQQRMNMLAGQSVKQIDMLFGYQPGEIQHLVAVYGPTARAVYALHEYTTDVIFPIGYTFLFSIVLSLLFRNRSYRPFGLINVLPVSMLLLELLENACIVFLLKTYPVPMGPVASLCSVITNLKWAVSLLVFSLIVYGLLHWLTSGRRVAGPKH